MTNLKGFSETSPERYRQLRKAVYIYKNVSSVEAVSAIYNASDVKRNAVQWVYSSPAFSTAGGNVG